ncbi:two-component sensor histidine kinase [Vagococcus penaei]|uniref:histidine kinase n=1 Tax=Vagococcus penaei TaxID=633807 RepID=A0A1Q2D4R2_9ENTE|nr:HAMP domain-containing sensor histidine kinase [Vagococcus penaei]AQP53392.1 two-component sensor histidine kinase [Vagococcus penaei]RST99714.1 two-component sensor histidine kinase [Vagococcus penaei]
MTIKKRIILSYFSGILITLSSLMLITALITYMTLGRVPSIQEVYKVLTTQRSLSIEERDSYAELNYFVQKSPDFFNVPLKVDIIKNIHEIEDRGLDVVIRKNNEFIYFSNSLVKKSLEVHSPDYELLNFEPIGTLDNAGRLFHYVKHDFQHLDGSKGSIIILKRESNFFEFFYRQGIWLVIGIILFSISLALYINIRLKQTIIQPLERLEKATHFVPSTYLTNEDIKSVVQADTAKEIKQLQKSFYKMWQNMKKNAELQKQYDTNRQELISNISHDLKTPITSIIGYVEGLKDGIATTEEKRQLYLETIHNKALNLNDLIETLFLYSKLELDNAIIQQETICLNQFISDLIVDYSLDTLIDWHYSLPVDSLDIKSDPQQLNRVFSNLIENSTKFRDPKKGKLSLTLELSKHESFAVINLSDNGIGMSEEELPFIFDRFYRADKSRSTLVKGSGLGLNIVQSIMLHHNGQISITSKKNIGTSVKLSFPLIKEDKNVETYFNY